MEIYMRKNQRRTDELRHVQLTPHYVIHPEGSVLIAMGNTKVLCNVTIEDTVPQWMQFQDKPGGWITAEYAMLPRSTHSRVKREQWGYRGRTQEIRRLIGRSLRGAVNLEKLGPRTCYIDCDVLQADGGTRTASITGGYVALRIALNKLINEGSIQKNVLNNYIAAVSVGVVDGKPMLDLCYEEDSSAQVDVNVVMTDQNQFIEIQGTAERETFSRSTLDELLNLAQLGIGELIVIQREVIDNL
jgi:ribonuclease PH